MKGLIYPLFLTGLCTGMTHAATEPLHTVLEDVIHNESLIRNGIVEFTAEGIRADTTGAGFEESAKIDDSLHLTERTIYSRSENKLVFKKGKRRIETEIFARGPVRNLLLVEKRAYNGEKLDFYFCHTSYKDGEKIPIMEPSASIRPAKSSQTHTYLKPGTFGFINPVYYGIPAEYDGIGSYLLKNRDSYEIQSGEKRDGVICHVLKQSKNNERIQINLWLAPRYGDNPVYIEIIKPEMTVVIQYYYPDGGDGGIHFPSRIVSRTYHKDGAGGEILDFTNKIEIVKCDFNLSIDDAEFELNFPKGVKVRDYRAKTAGMRN